jgi:polyisoprenoid-binding protein YceI
MAKTKWVADLHHSEIHFKVKHLMIATVTGSFLKFNVGLETEDEEFTKFLKLEFSAEVNSVQTNNEQRDNHLKSADFFEGKEFATGNNGGELLGKLTIKDVTKDITLTVEYGGAVTDPYGQRKAGFSIHGDLNRKDFGLTWSAATEAGKIIVSDEVKFYGEIQLQMI